MISAPSAAILGCDPFIVAESNDYPIVREGCDSLRLRNGKSITIDLVNKVASFS
jgi:hypothetical protein